MGNQLSTDTLCSRDSKGHSYWVDMGRKAFAKGDSKKCYLGYLNGLGPRSGEKVVVKVPKENPDNKKTWQAEILKAETTKFFLMAFTKNHPTGARIRVNHIFVALMDTVSILGPNKLNGNEYVGIEDFIPGTFSSWNPEDNMLLIEAFSHFSYQHSNGALVISDFRGVEKYGFYHITNPTIHSRNYVFGTKDKGNQAINEFFKHHRCNDICRGWEKMRPLSPPPSFEEPSFLPPYSND